MRLLLLLAFLSLLGLSACANTPEGVEVRGEDGQVRREARVELDLPADWDFESYSNLTLGEPLPDIILPDTDGNVRSLAEFRGKKLLLINFASW